MYGHDASAVCAACGFTFDVHEFIAHTFISPNRNSADSHECACELRRPTADAPSHTHDKQCDACPVLVAREG
jgi:hypothetical protein